MTRVQFLVLCLLLFLPTYYGKGVQYIVEEDPPTSKPHLHPLRKPGKVVSPYKSAASTITNSKSERYESFSLNCPHVSDAANRDVKVEVTWTVNDTIWLKIENGLHTIYNKLSTFTKKTVGGKSVLRVMLNNGRYFFDYDEITGEFSMEIHPVTLPEDAGVWQCHVTVYQLDNTYTLTSRSRVKVPREHRHGTEEDKKNPTLPAAQSQIFMVERDTEGVVPRSLSGKTSSFTRNDGGFVHINRDESIKYNQVIFNRQSPYARNRPKHLPTYYDELDGNYPRSRTRSLPNNSPAFSSCLLFTVFLYILY